METNSKKANFRQVCEQSRYIIQALLKEKMTTRHIADHLGKNRRTIEREIKRGTRLHRDTNLVDRPKYDPYFAHEQSKKRLMKRGRKPKIAQNSKEAQRIYKKMKKDKYSPDATVAFFKNDEKPLSVCTKTIYNYIHNGYFGDIVMKKRKRKKSEQRKVSFKNPTANSIDNRPIEANQRKANHWEMDCAVGKGKDCLLVLTERCFRKEIIRKMPQKTQINVQLVLDDLEKEYGEQFPEVFESITCDNGGEFLDSKSLERSFLYPEQKRTSIYYAHPYSAWERGSNEVANKLIRKFIKKGDDIAKYSNKHIQKIEDWMNNYPRKMFDYKSANGLLAEHNASLRPLAKG